MRRYRRSIWTNCVLSITLCAVCGCVITVILTALFAVFTYFLMDSMALGRAFTLISLGGGAFGGGYICGRFRRRRGLFEGAVCGGAIFLVMFIIALSVGAAMPSIKKLLLLAAICAAGGVTGVNSKRPKNLRND